EAYTRKIGELAADLSASAANVTHPLLQKREAIHNSLLLVICSNRGLCGGYNASILREAMARIRQLPGENVTLHLELSGKRATRGTAGSATAASRVEYEFLPNARDILEEILPVSFKVRLFKCFLDAAVSEQIARRVAMKAATENAGDIIKTLTRQYNRARQAQITKAIPEVIGGAGALK